MHGHRQFREAGFSEPPGGPVPFGAPYRRPPCRPCRLILLSPDAERAFALPPPRAPQISIPRRTRCPARCRLESPPSACTQDTGPPVHSPPPASRKQGMTFRLPYFFFRSLQRKIRAKVTK